MLFCWKKKGFSIVLLFIFFILPLKSLAYLDNMQMFVEHFAIASDLENKGKLLEAISEYENLAKIFPNYRILYEKLAVLYANIEQPGVALVWASAVYPDKMVEHLCFKLQNVGKVSQGKVILYMNKLSTVEIAQIQRLAAFLDNISVKFSKDRIYVGWKVENLEDVPGTVSKKVNKVNKTTRILERIKVANVDERLKLILELLKLGEFDEALKWFEMTYRQGGYRDVLLFERIADNLLERLKMVSDKSSIYKFYLGVMEFILGDYELAMKVLESVKVSGDYEKLRKFYLKRAKILYEEELEKARMIQELTGKPVEKYFEEKRVASFREARKKSCRQIRKELEEAIKLYNIDHLEEFPVGPIDVNKLVKDEYLKGKPDMYKCPSGGEYIYLGGGRVRCTVHGE